MEKSWHSSANNTNTSSSSSSSSTTTNSTNLTQNPLKLLNKSSHKISKPISKPNIHTNPNPNPNPIPTRPSPPPGNLSHHHNPQQQQNQQPQPPVYNINKNDFRDVVQKLTGSPAHHHTPPPPPAAIKSEAPTSRLHKIRPPPLAHVRPPLIAAPPPPPPASAGDGWHRPPLSPLPPFPSVSAAAESPISAYMRCLQTGSTPSGPTGLVNSPGSVVPMPSSPLAFGCMMLSPSMLFPPSPGLPMPSPRWRDL